MEINRVLAVHRSANCRKLTSTSIYLTIYRRHVTLGFIRKGLAISVSKSIATRQDYANRSAGRTRAAKAPKGVSYERFAAEGWHEAGKLGLDHGIK